MKAAACLLVALHAVACIAETPRADQECWTEQVHSVVQLRDGGAVHGKALHVHWPALWEYRSEKEGDLALQCDETGEVYKWKTSLRWITSYRQDAVQCAPLTVPEELAQWLSPPASSSLPGSNETRGSLILVLKTWYEEHVGDNNPEGLRTACRVANEADLANRGPGCQLVWRASSGDGLRTCPLTGSDWKLSRGLETMSVRHRLDRIARARRIQSTCLPSSSSSSRSDDGLHAVFLEHSRGKLVRHRPGADGSCGAHGDDPAFAEVAASVSAGIPGLDAMMEPILDGLLEPVTKLIGGVLGDTLGDGLSQTLGQSVDAGLTSQITSQLSNSLSTSLTTQVVTPLSASLSETISELITAQLEDEVGSKLAPEVAEAVAGSLPDAVVPSLVDGITEDVSAALAQSLGRSLLHMATRSVTESVVPALTMSLAHSPAESYYCDYCTRTGKYCDYCPDGEGRPPSTLPHAHYFAAYYAAYFAELMDPAEIVRLQAN